MQSKLIFAQRGQKFHWGGGGGPPGPPWNRPCTTVLLSVALALQTRTLALVENSLPWSRGLSYTGRTMQ